MKSKDLAMEACVALVEAYKNGERNEGSVDWDDVDQAHNLATQAVDADKNERRKNKR